MTMRPRSDRPLWTRFTGRTMVLVGLVAIVLIVLASFPLIEPPEPQPDPAADAEAAYRSLVAQVDSRGELGELSPSATGRVQTLITALAGTDSLARPATGIPPRDLFAPAPEPKPAPAPAPPRPRKPSRPRLPELNGVLIDGASRRAMIGGELAAIGDEVGGYRLVAIDADGVALERQQKTYRLELGAK